MLSGVCRYLTYATMCNPVQAEQAAKERQVQAARRERQALKADLERVLKERGRFESLKHLVVAALGSTARPSQQEGVRTQQALHQEQQAEALLQGPQWEASVTADRVDVAHLISNVQA
jgi:hypothetical protein